MKGSDFFIMSKKLMIKESNDKTIYDDIVKKVLTPYLEPYSKSAIKLFDSPFSVYDERRGLVTVGESMLGNIAYNYAKENGYSSTVLNLVGNYYDVDSALIISVKDGRQRTYPKFTNISRNLSGSLKKELTGLSIKLNDVVRDIANELIKEFKGITNESMKRGKCKMVRKLYIKENAITDLRKWVDSVGLDDLENKNSGYYNRKYSPYSRYGTKGDFVPAGNTIKQGLISWIERTLKSNWDFDFNAEQLELVPVPAPKSSVAAKKNPNLLIGIDSRTGDAVIIGKGQFYAYYSGKVNSADKGSNHSTGVPDDPNPDHEFKTHRVNLRDNFSYFDLWLEIIEPEGYQKRSEIRNGRQNDLTTFTSNDKKYLEKQIYSFERELYDPEIARRKYAKKLEVVKNRKQYEDTLNSIDNINDRIKSINFGHPIFDDMQFDQRSIDNLKKTYKSLVYHIDGLNNGIEKNDKWDIDYHLRYIPDYLGDLDRMLTDKFGV